jgi:ribosomal protein S18 acetylase RimI-like enzyme
MPLDFYRTKAEVPATLERSDAESRRFGFEIGRLELTTITDDQPTVLQSLFLRSELDVLILRYPAEGVDWPARLRHPDIAVLHCDTLLYFRKDLGSRISAESDGTARIATSADAGVLIEAVASTFENYPNHYAANPLLDRSAARDGYTEWVTSSLLESTDSCVLLCENHAGQLLGFATLRTTNEGEILLAGILPEQRGQGAYNILMASVERAFTEHAIRSCVISTQPANRRAIRTWIQRGFQYETAYVTLHLVKGRALHALDTLNPAPDL